MLSLLEIILLACSALFLLLRVLPYFLSYRRLFGGACALLFISAIYPRTGNRLGEFLFGSAVTGLRLPREFFGVIWWILGAWLFKTLLDLVLSRTFFPDNDEPHARRLFADLASGLIYILAFVGILGVVFKEPVSAFFATSGVLAIVLGLALQSTLGDVFSGLAINIERPFGAGDWITLAGQASGEVMQVNWRATRLRTVMHELVVIPNSIASKAVVANHSRPKGPYRCVVNVKVDIAVSPTRVLKMLIAAATGSTYIVQGTVPLAFACEILDSLVLYELVFSIDRFALSFEAKSDMLERIADTFRENTIHIGPAPLDIRIVPGRNPNVEADGRAVSLSQNQLATEKIQKRDAHSPA
jgi:small-conductance mechanosensitive channel